MRAYAAAHFPFDDVMTVTWNDAEAKLQSEYTGGEDGRAYAVTIHGEIRGLADTVEDAEARFSNMIGNCLPLIAVAANAAIDDPLAVATHGLDISEPQPFIGYRTPSASEWFPPGKRLIDAEATHAFMAAVGNHPQGELLLRVIEAYRRALANWIPERRLVAGEYLFISAETLGRFMIEGRAAGRQMRCKEGGCPNCIDWMTLSEARRALAYIFDYAETLYTSTYPDYESYRADRRTVAKAGEKLWFRDDVDGVVLLVHSEPLPGSTPVVGWRAILEGLLRCRAIVGKYAPKSHGPIPRDPKGQRDPDVFGVRSPRRADCRT